MHSSRQPGKEWEAIGCTFMLALVTSHAHQSRSLSRIRAIVTRTAAPCTLLQRHKRRVAPTSISARHFTNVHRVFHNSPARLSGSSNRIRAGSGGVDDAAVGQGGSSRINKQTHPLFQDLHRQQQQQHRQQPRHQRLSPMPTKPTKRVDPQTRLSKNVTGATTPSGSHLSPADIPWVESSHEEHLQRDEERLTEDRSFINPGNTTTDDRAAARHPFCEYSSASDNVVERAPPPPGSSVLHGSTMSFSACRSPAQLRKAIHHFLASHPQPSSQHMVEMLQSCVDLGRMASSTPTSSLMAETRRKNDGKSHTTATMSSLDMLSSALLDSIYYSLEFSSEEVYQLATWIYQRSWDEERLSSLPSDSATLIMRPTPSAAVLNQYLRVCATTNHVDQAVKLFDERERILKEVKPEVSLYAHWLWAMANYESSPSSPRMSIDAKAQEVINVASKTLAHQARYPFWIKMALGGMIGGTVGKFTTLGLMALPGFHADTFSGPEASSVSPTTVDSMEAAVNAASHVGSSLSADGILHALASTEVATTAGLATFALSFGLFLIRDTTTTPGVVLQMATRRAQVHHGKSGKIQNDHQEQDQKMDSTANICAQGKNVAEEKKEGGEDIEEVADDTELILDNMQQVQRLPRARFVGPYFFQDLVSTDEGTLRTYLEEQYQQLKKIEKRNKIP